MPTPESLARENIDRQLTAAGWAVQSIRDLNVYAAKGIALREYRLDSGPVDYLLLVDRQAVGVVEAKAEGTTLTEVERQAARYGEGLKGIPAPVNPLPFQYVSTGVETRFTNLLDPEPRSREVFHFHRPETLIAWLAEEPLWLPKGHRLVDKPASLRLKLQNLPTFEQGRLWAVQYDAVRNLEKSFGENRPRALIQMATGSGKTFTAVTSIYRLIKEGGARRVLFLVDRGNLGRQALKEFEQYVTPDDGRKFTELYNVQLLKSGRIDPVANVCISTIQRLYSMLQGKELDAEADEESVADQESLYSAPVPVAYNPKVPVETFDVVFVDECHRSIYTLWRQVLDYFDAFLVGLTATPSKQTFGYFNQNLITEYGHAQAVADGVNVDFDVYRIRTRITEQGSTVDAGFWVDRRERETRKRRWERLDTDLTYAPNELDRDVVALDQIRTVVRSFRDKLREIFPGRTDIPKTLIFAKQDSHADDVVQVVREEFAKGNDFAQKITNKSRLTGADPEDLIRAFRNSYLPRIAVTVDMIATGTDIKPLEVVMFLRQVKSRNLFEQMKGRGVRVINDADFRAVTPDGGSKTRFVIIDAVGVTEHELSDTQPLDRKPTIALEKLFRSIALGTADADTVSSVAGRLVRLDRQLTNDEHALVSRTAGGRSLSSIAKDMISAVDPDQMEAEGDAVPQVIEEACKPLAANPQLRQLILDLKKSKEQTIDTVSKDEVLEVGYSPEAKERAKGLVESFERFIKDNKDEITALEILYTRPYGRRLRYDDIKELAAAIQAPPRQWTPERLWQAYETLFASRVRGAPSKVLTNLVSLVRFAVSKDELTPFPDVVDQRFAAWLAQQDNGGRKFTEEQRAWLDDIREHIAANVEIAPEDFGYAPFAQRGGLGAAHRVFGTELKPLLEELTGVLAA